VSRPWLRPLLAILLCFDDTRSTREWAVGVISTVVTEIGGGAMAVQYFGLQE